MASADSLLVDLELLGFLFGKMAETDQKNPHHNFDVLRHCRYCFVSCYSMMLPAEVKLAGLFHDIGKINCYHFDSDGVQHFYRMEETEDGVKKIRHEDVGADHEGLWMVMKDIGFDKTTIERAKWYIRHHGDTIAPTKKAIKRYLNKIIDESIEQKMDFFLGTSAYIVLENLIKLKIADCESKSDEKDTKETDELKNCLILLREIEEEKTQLKVQDLLIDGNDVKSELRIKDGPMVGKVLDYILDKVLGGEIENERETLLDYLNHLFIHGIQ